MRVLVTRPSEDAVALARALGVRGHEAVVAPLLTIVARPDAAVDLAGVQAILVTSANGARAFGRVTARRDLPVLAVGAASSAAARDEGFADVRVAGGDVAALAGLAAQTLDARAGPLLHVAGGDVAGDLGGALGSRGFAVRRAVLYEARVAAALPDPARGALERGTIDAVLLFSPRTAAAFVDLTQRAGLEPALGRVEAACLSQAVAAAARGLPWRRMRVAARPTTEALLDLLADAGDGDAPTPSG